MLLALPIMVFMAIGCSGDDNQVLYPCKDGTHREDCGSIGRVETIDVTATPKATSTPGVSATQAPAATPTSGQGQLVPCPDGKTFARTQADCGTGASGSTQTAPGSTANVTRTDKCQASSTPGADPVLAKIQLTATELFGVQGQPSCNPAFWGPTTVPGSFAVMFKYGGPWTRFYVDDGNRVDVSGSSCGEKGGTGVYGYKNPGKTYAEGNEATALLVPGERDCPPGSLGYKGN
jgi:hypothetical protein